MTKHDPSVWFLLRMDEDQIHSVWRNRLTGEDKRLSPMDVQASGLVIKMRETLALWEAGTDRVPVLVHPANTTPHEWDRQLVPQQELGNVKGVWGFHLPTRNRVRLSEVEARHLQIGEAPEPKAPEPKAPEQTIAEELVPGLVVTMVFSPEAVFSKRGGGVEIAQQGVGVVVLTPEVLEKLRAEVETP